MTLYLWIGVESRFDLDWYHVNGAVGELIDALATEDITDQTAIAHLPAIRSAVKDLTVVVVEPGHAEIPHLLRPTDKLTWARDKPEGPERWRIRRYPAIDAATAAQAATFYDAMYRTLAERIREPVIHIRPEQIGVCSRARSTNG